MKKYNEKVQRRLIQWITIPVLPVVIIGGYFWPYLGFIVGGLIIFFILLSIFKGRLYCGWFCPMGSFYERILSAISLKKDIPALFKKTWFRWIMFMLLICFFVSRLVWAGVDPLKTGIVLSRMWIIAMSGAIIIGIIFKPRSWCRFCPMGTVQGMIGKKSYLLNIMEKCTQCGVCLKVCPIETYPGLAKERGTVNSEDCIRCANCVVNCPHNALYFNKKNK
ncbi:MAG: 4Fe-4S binding protein [bacterium]